MSRKKPSKKKKTKSNKPKKNNKSKSKKSNKIPLVKLLIPIFITAIVVVIAVLFALSLSSNVVATVNGEPITEEELDFNYNLVFFLAGYPEEYKSLLTKEMFLSQYANEQVLVQEANKKGISVDNEKVDEAIQDFISSSGLTEKEVESEFRKKGFSLNDLRNHYKRSFLVLNLLEKELFSKINISNEEAENYYNDNKDEFEAGKGEIRIRHILVETEQQAQDLLEQLDNGSDFSELASEYSICPSSSKGGDLGYIKEGQMVEKFEEAAFDLDAGEMSDIVETQFGYHIILREEDKISYEEAKESIKQIIKEQEKQALIEKYVASLTEEAEIEINYNANSTGKGNEETDKKDEESEENENITETENITDSETELQESESCHESNGISDNTVIFYHADWCGHCNKMKPIVDELVEQGYDIMSVESSTADASVIKECFSDVLSGAIPQFICAGTREDKLGAMSKDSLKEFAENCI